MKRKWILIIAIALLVVTLGTLCVACKKKGPSAEEQKQENIKEAVETSLTAHIITQQVLGKLPDNYVFSYCTRTVTEKEDGTFAVSGKVYISSSSGKGYASYSCTVDAEYEVHNMSVGTFYKA